VDFFRRQNWDLVGRSWIWFTLSGVLLLAGITMWATMGLNLGIDFTGGGMIRYEFARPIAANRDQQVDVLAKVKTALEGIQLGSAQVLVGGNDELIVRTPPVKNDTEALAQEGKVRGEVEKLFGAEYGPITPLGRESVGPVVGAQLRASALNALILGCFLILLYITIRYEFRFAVAAVIALVHDVFMIIGAMALFRMELDSSFVAVVLTVIGFSVHDTIVIFDRIRENLKLHRRSNFADTVNASLLQTMTRSINTVMTVLFTLVALAIFGSGSIRVFSIAMTIGIISGAYSSIFNASQIVVVWDRYSSRRKTAAGGVQARRRERQRLTGTQASATAVDDDLQDEYEDDDAQDAAPRRLSAQEAMARAEDLAQAEKREARRERRKQQRDGGSGRSKGKKRF
jgi:preprotein translocase subunit SecF